MYGRGAAALAREINKVVEDPVTVETTQSIIDSLAKSFPVAWKWLVDNAEKAVTDEYLETLFGRCRYFQGISQMPSWDQAAAKREAKNSPIQGTVADLLAQSGVQLSRLLRRPGMRDKLDVRILLPIHDAFLFEVKVEHLRAAIPAMKLCMADRNCLPGTDKHLEIDIEIFPRSWGDKAYHVNEIDQFYEKIGLANPAA